MRLNTNPMKQVKPVAKTRGFSGMKAVKPKVTKTTLANMIRSKKR